jgi:hypothetical protein
VAGQGLNVACKTLSTTMVYISYHISTQSTRIYTPFKQSPHTTMTQQEEYFRNALRLYASLQISLELCTQVKNYPQVKNSLKAKISNLERQLAVDISPQINKLYETDEKAIQVIQTAIAIIRDNALENIVDRALEIESKVIA